MVIDFHTHIFPESIAQRTISSLSEKAGIKASTDGTITGLLDFMERSGIDISVIMPVVTKPSQFQSVNIFAQQINEKYKGHLISFGGIHPDSQNYKEELKAIKSMELPGIKLHPDYQNVMIDDLRYLKIVDYASELGLITLIHAGIDIGLPEPIHCTPQRLRRVIDEVHPEKLIAAHMGGWKMWDDVYEYLAGQNIYLDTSFSMNYMGQEMFMKIMGKHGSDKILFASDSPWGEVSSEVKMIQELPLNSEEKADILVNNGKRLLKI